MEQSTPAETLWNALADHCESCEDGCQFDDETASDADALCPKGQAMWTEIQRLAQS